MPNNATQVSSQLKDFLRQHNLYDGLAVKLAPEGITLSDLRKMAAAGQDQFFDAMRDLNVGRTEGTRLFELLGGGAPLDASEPLSGRLTYSETEEDVGARQALASFAKAQRKAETPAAASSVFSSDVLAAALSSVSSAKPSAAAKRAAAAQRVAATGDEGKRVLHYGDSSLSYDSWKAGVAESEGERKDTSAALLAYQSRAAREGDFASHAEKVVDGRIVIAGSEAKDKKSTVRPLGMWS